MTKLKEGDVVVINWKNMDSTESIFTKYNGCIGVIDETVDYPDAYWVEVGVANERYLFRDLLLCHKASLHKIGTLN